MKNLESFKNKIFEFSKKSENQDITFKVICTNYSDKNNYYLRNGIFAIADNFNTKYAFQSKPIKLNSLKKDAIYKITEIEKTDVNIKIYNI